MKKLKEEVRNAIVKAAFEEFSEHGYLEASMRRISAAAQISTGNIYRYFSGKEELFDHIIGSVYAKYSTYTKEYLQTVDLYSNQDETAIVAFLEQVSTTYVTLLKTTGPRLRLMMCKSQGSKYEGLKLEMIEFTEKLLLQTFSLAKPIEQLSQFELAEIKVLATTLIDGLVFIIDQYEEHEIFSFLIDRLISIHSIGISNRLEELKQSRR
ncbi:TetR/AcrR family transcriptional regulator [Shimazuella kribbensis]|uniref:TetR/AcrR family transcriptional regulator n=1 Tax=Shimazuella kribbensis TaxID=139808 RepID=UPI000415E037|nr:TetR/AcrR family transcriptional regulator [Shimazuella kribbensis]